MLDLTQMTSFALPIGSLISLVFYLVLAAYVIFTAIFYYHWKTYSTDKKITGLTLFLFGATTIPLLLVMGIMTVII